jgi:hypothetical protein
MDLDSAYKVDYVKADQAYLHRVINPKRGPTDSVPGLDMAKSAAASDRMFTEFGLEQFVGCVTAEMKSRPIPHVFRVSETAALTALYKDWAPFIFRRIFRELEPPTQTYNKVSRLGWPYFENPDNKRDILAKDFAHIKAKGIAEYSNAFIIVNVRLQAEAKAKRRKYMFMDSTGRVYEQETSPEFRAVKVKGVGERVCSRTRLIFNLPIPNLYKQVLDSAVHNVFLKYPAFHHDMFNKRLLPVKGYHLCLDVKHFERFTANSVRHRASDVIQGRYGDIGALFASIPFALPSDDYSEYFYAYPNRDGGWSDQFASGDSAVAPVQKEIFTALYAEYFSKTRGLGRDEAIATVFNGGDGRLCIRNYGDDNSLSGERSELDAVARFLADFLEVEEEVPPKFLGFEWIDDDWKLPESSYLLKTYLNERRPYSNFRRFPNLGWKLKRDTYRQLGVRSITEQIFPFEEKVLASLGLNWTDVLWRAENERKQTLGLPGQLNPNFIMGKDYAMSAAEKLTTGEFIGLTPTETAPIIKDLLPAEWAKQLRW